MRQIVSSLAAAALVPWSRALVLAVVVAIHLLALTLAWPGLHQAPRHSHSGQAAPPERSRTMVFLLAPSAPLAISPRQEKALTDARPAQPDRLSGQALPAPVRGDELSTAPVTATATATATAAQALPPSVAASEETPKPTGAALNLTLSRESLRSLGPSAAAKSPFEGSVPLTVERRIADAAAETGPWTEERIDIDHVRMRRGTTCVILSRPQIAKIDPFSDASKRVPWGASKPSECR
jgi:hypothetical protein